MKFNPICRMAQLAPALVLALALAGCNAGNPNAPVINYGLSSENLQLTVDAGESTSGYVTYSDAIGESVASNIDALSGVNLDTSGKTGLLTIAPPANQVPGMYYLTINAINTNGTVANTVEVNVLPPGQPGTPTIINFPMNGYTQTRAIVTLFDARVEIGPSTTPQILTPAGGSPSNEGVNVNAIYTTLNSGSNTFMASADLTVDLSQLQKSTVTDAAGNTYTNGILLNFSAAPGSADNTVFSPYVESIYLNPI